MNLLRIAALLLLSDVARGFVSTSTNGARFCSLRCRKQRIHDPTKLCMTRKEDKSSRSKLGSNSLRKDIESRSFSISDLDFGGLVGDLVALLVSFEIKGLVDATNAPDFIAKGGWLRAPPPMSESTLPLLLERFSVNGILWIVAGVAVAAFDNTQKVDNNSTLLSFGAFLLLRCLLAAALGSEVYDVLLEAYYVGLAIGGLRFIQKQLGF
mmetsp:Transcript_35904/g.74661  ORF Transcript_35904/g.74661 Transcript_35904/m.74661 type:complete len:210 (+) Transcript_35904:54-683(+)